MSGVEVVACVAAVVSAFHGGAELITIIRDKRSRRKEKKEQRWQQQRESEMEQFFQERMLQTSLTDGEHRVQDHYDVDQRQLGYAYRRGDDIATSQLKDVVINMQGEIIRSLQIAVSVEQAVLDLTKLHEASITNRMSAERTMDDLRQRIILTLPVPRQLQDNTHQGREEGFEYEGYLDRMPSMRRRGSNESIDSFRTAEVDLPAAVTIPGREPSRHAPRRMLTNAGGSRSDGIPQREPSRRFLPFTLLSLPKQDTDIMTLGGFRMHDEDEDSDDDLSRHMASRVMTLDEEDEEQQELPPDLPARPSISVTTASSSSGPPTAGPSYRPFVRQSQSSASTAASIASNETSSTNDPITPSTSGASSTFSNGGVPVSRNLSATMTYAEIERSQRKYSAPEAVHPPNPPRQRNQSMPTQPPPRHTQQQQPTVAFKDPTRPWLGLHAVPWITVQSSTPRNLAVHKPIDAWLPLAKYAKVNNYHGFCKGSWLARGKSPKEGISVSQIPLAGAIYSTVPHWQCKKCSFKSEPLQSNTSPIPNRVFVSQSGLRYRWLFLLKSHAVSKDTLTKTGNYSYCCIFCAAEGKATATYGGLVTLVEHIVANHRPENMTPDVLAKTRTVVGRVADNDDPLWDVNFPEHLVEMDGSERGGRSSHSGSDAITWAT